MRRDSEWESSESGPGKYWRALIPDAERHLIETNWADLKGLPGMRPRYAEPGSNPAEAQRDYAVFRFCDRDDVGPNLRGFSEAVRATDDPGMYVQFDGHVFTKCSLKYLRALAWTKNYLPVGWNPRFVLEVGGGYGVLAEILLKGDPTSVYLGVDIYPAAYAAQAYIGEVLGQEIVARYADYRTAVVIDGACLFAENTRAAVLLPGQARRLSNVRIDLAIAFKCFQEMEPESIREHLRTIDRLHASYVLIMNRVRGGNVAPEPGRPGVEAATPLDTIVEQLDHHREVARLSPPFSDGGQVLVLLERSSSK